MLVSTPTIPRRTAIFTISSNNYVPYARTLISSSLAVHPDADHFYCLVDERLPMPQFYPTGCTVITADALAIPDFRSFAFRYDMMEINTAAKPYMILHLFALGYDRVVYFDPDIKLYRPIEPVFAAMDAGASVVLTPHVTRPSEGEAPPNDISFLRAGVYNLGFAAFHRRPEVEEVVRWWCRRLRFDCLNAQPEGIFVDQKFIDLVPGFLAGVAILRETTLNAAYWNLVQRDLDWNGAQWTVDGDPLIFFHFSGYDARRSHRLSKHTALFADAIAPALAALLEDYRADLLAHGLNDTPRAIYAYQRFASGAAIPDVVRRLFRERHLTWDGDPFVSFEKYLGQVAADTPPGAEGIACTNLMRYLWEDQPYLKTTYDISRPHGVAGLHDWFLRDSHRSGIDPRLTTRVVDRVAAARARRRQRVPGAVDPAAPDVSVIGYLTADTGVGEAGRLTLRALAAGTRRVDALDVALNVVASRDNRSCRALLTDQARGRAHIFHVNADQLPAVQTHLRHRLRDAAYRIAVPFWELADFPDEWLAAFDGVDEIWAPTRFVQAALAAKLDKPVLRMPIAFQFGRPARGGRRHFGLPERRFIFLFSFDFLSFSGRKNPRAVIDAFTMAFAGRAAGRDVSLVVKCVNAGFAAAEMKRLRSSLDAQLDIRFIDRPLSRPEMLALVDAVDCVVSLHRSEGLGLLIAEAMALGTPVIATDYSATTELVSPSTGYPVDYRLVPLQPGDYPHAAGKVWADPDLSHAAWQMRLAVEQAGTNADLVARARRHIETEHGTEAVLRQQAMRLEELGL